jgi:hypothetical protein
MSRVGELVRRRRSGCWLGLTVALLTLAGATPALAAITTTIPGSPLTIYADDNGQLEVAFAGAASGEFAPPSLQPANAGLNIAVTDAVQFPPFVVHGFLGSAFNTNQLPGAVLSGDGGAGNPWKLVTQYQTASPGADPNVTVEQTLTYVNGSTDVTAQYRVTNAGDSPTARRIRVYEVADLFVAGDDRGVGFLEPGPPRQVGGINEAAGSSGRLVEVTPWARFQEGAVGNVLDIVRNPDINAPGFNNTTDPALLNNGVGVQWDIPSLARGDFQTFQVVWRFRHFTPLALSLVAATRAQGQTATVTVAARNSDGNPDPGRTIRYVVNGANPSLGTVTTGADGTAAITWSGAFNGLDTLTAFTDLNGNGTLDGNEPSQSVTVTWTSPLPPVPGKSVVVKVVSGTVFVKYPPGYIPRAVVPAKGFVPFKGAANVPVGTQFDTKGGRVALTSAADTGGKKTQTSDFYAGIFAVKQALPKTQTKKAVALITDLVLKGQTPRSQCAPLKGASAAAVDANKKKKGPKSVLGKLWGNGKGKFRTTGKYSSATVRGTIWLTEDRCDGTLTRVRRGTVRVFDRKRKKAVTVKAPHGYLARALRLASKRHN